MRASIYDDRIADDRERAEELRRGKKDKLVYYRRYAELTVEQAVYVNTRMPANGDPWLYEYELQGGRIIDRYRLTGKELAEAIR